LFILEIRPFGNKCNKKCAYCYQPKQSLPAAWSITPEAIKGFIDRIPFSANGLPNKEPIKLVLHGGEPILDEGKWAISLANLLSSKVRSKEIFPCIQTHGHYDTKIISQLLGHNFWLAFSVDFPLKEKPISKQLLENIYAADKVGRLAAVQMVVSEELTQQREPLILEFIRSLPQGTNFKLIPMMSKGNIKESLIYYEKSLAFFGAEFFQMSQKISVEPIYQMITRQKIPGCRFSFGCSLKGSITKTACIDYDGLIFPCNRFAAIRKFCLGTIFEEKWPLKLSFLREELRHHCEICIVGDKELCLKEGGCVFHRDFLNSPSDPFCEIEQTIMERFIRVTSPNSD